MTRTQFMFSLGFGAAVLAAHSVKAQPPAEDRIQQELFAKLPLVSKKTAGTPFLARKPRPALLANTRCEPDAPP